MSCTHTSDRATFVPSFNPSFKLRRCPNMDSPAFRRLCDDAGEPFDWRADCRETVFEKARRELARFDAKRAKQGGMVDGGLTFRDDAEVSL